MPAVRGHLAVEVGAGEPDGVRARQVRAREAKKWWVEHAEQWRGEGLDAHLHLGLLVGNSGFAWNGHPFRQDDCASDK